MLLVEAVSLLKVTDSEERSNKEITAVDSPTSVQRGDGLEFDSYRCHHLPYLSHDVQSSPAIVVAGRCP